jgi:hypothetical protein
MEAEVAAKALLAEYGRLAAMVSSRDAVSQERWQALLERLKRLHDRAIRHSAHADAAVMPDCDHGPVTRRAAGHGRVGRTKRRLDDPQARTEPT